MRRELFGSTNTHNKTLQLSQWKNQILRIHIPKRIPKNFRIQCTNDPTILDKPGNKNLKEDQDSELKDVWKRIGEYSTNLELENIEKPLKINIDLLLVLYFIKLKILINN